MSLVPARMKTKPGRISLNSHCRGVSRIPQYSGGCQYWSPSAAIGVADQLDQVPDFVAADLRENEVDRPQAGKPDGFLSRTELNLRRTLLRAGVSSGGAGRQPSP